MRKSVTIPATLEAVSGFTASLEADLKQMPAQTRMAVVLAVQELCVNIVKHAYRGTRGDIHIQIDWSSQGLDITCTDSAPTTYTPPEVITAPDPLLLPESGMGMFIIYQTFDRVEYEHLDHGNRWHVQKLMENTA